MTLTEPQVWVLIGAFVAAVGTMITVTLTSFHRSLYAVADGIRAEIRGLRAEMNVRFDAVNAEMNVRFDAVNANMEHLDRDVSALAKRVLGD
ncbi:hypothetical protein N8K70_01355 [Microbacterium betulae]|uniref:DUF2746 domain-containing protein n=1 Tax=Microbacterium betulae TaxID=2981139 RepID=A0AA97FHL6_9MICO|nr:hypothetical protein [Microbacterium sp. AB]WOF23348.1 hypothetical protein N8K70_01355 [Microbacterium sp. AB]